MFSRYTKLLVAGVLAQILIGCSPVPYKPIQTSPAFWEKEQSKTILVASTKVPEPHMALMGQIGLLDLAIISAASNSQNEFLKKLDTSRTAQICTNLGKRLEDRGFTVKYAEKAIDRDTLQSYKAEQMPELFAPHDLRSFGKGPQKADYVLLIDVRHVGTQRSYYGFMPLTAPAAAFQARAMLASTVDNKLAWYDTVDSVLPIPDPWDEAPDFANLGKAVTSNMNTSATKIERSLFDIKAPAPAEPAAQAPAAGNAKVL